VSLQVQVVHDELTRKAENSTADQAIRQLQALNDAMSGKADTTKHNLLIDQLHRLREDVFTMKADFSRLEELGRQLENLSATVTIDNARVKHLCNMYAGHSVGGSAWHERQISGGNSSTERQLSGGNTARERTGSHASSSTSATTPSPAPLKQLKTGLPSMTPSSSTTPVSPHACSNAGVTLPSVRGTV